MSVSQHYQWPCCRWINTTLLLLVELKENEIIVPLTISKVEKCKADQEASQCVCLCVGLLRERERAAFFMEVFGSHIKCVERI